MLEYNQCPWDQFAPSTIYFCEGPTCTWISHPAEAVSSFMFCFTGIWLIYDALKRNAPSFTLFGISSIFIGIFSFVFHATMTFWGEILDLGSMYFFVATCLSISFKRYWPQITLPQVYAITLFISLFSLLLLAFYKPLGPWTFGVMITSAVALEIFMRKTNRVKGAVDYRYMVSGLALLLLAWGRVFRNN